MHLTVLAVPDCPNAPALEDGSRPCWNGRAVAVDD
jgi:hypothetical protein